jgi:amino acid transporter
MRQPKTSTILAIAIALVAILTLMAASMMAVWLTEEVRVVGLIAVPTALVAGLLVVYFEWRTKVRRRMLAKGRDFQALEGGVT